MVRGNFVGFLPQWIALQTEHSLSLFARWHCGAAISISQVWSHGTQFVGGHKWACPGMPAVGIFNKTKTKCRKTAVVVVVGNMHLLLLFLLHYKNPITSIYQQKRNLLLISVSSAAAQNNIKMFSLYDNYFQNNKKQWLVKPCFVSLELSAEISSCLTLKNPPTKLHICLRICSRTYSGVTSL